MYVCNDPKKNIYTMILSHLQLRFNHGIKLSHKVVRESGR